MRMLKSKMTIYHKRWSELVHEGNGLCVRLFRQFGLMRMLFHGKSSINDWRQRVNCIIID